MLGKTIIGDDGLVYDEDEVGAVFRPQEGGIKRPGAETVVTKRQLLVTATKVARGFQLYQQNPTPNAARAIVRDIAELQLAISRLP